MPAPTQTKESPMRTYGRIVPLLPRLSMAEREATGQS
jgi:hypothetical protein